MSKRLTWTIPLSIVRGSTPLTLGTDEDLYVAGDVTIASTADVAVRLEGWGHRVVVDGTLVGQNGGLLGWNAGYNTLTFGEEARVIGLEGSALRLSGRSLVVLNEGQVVSRGSGDHVAGMAFGAPAGSGTRTSVNVENHGSISAASGAGIIVSAGVETFGFVNQGAISGGHCSYESSGALTRDFIQNFGRIEGDVRLGGGDDQFIFHEGVVNGTVFGGDGHDQLISYGAPCTFNGGGGADYLVGGTDGDVLSGGSGDDRLNANEGNDSLRGGDGKDTLSGGQGDDDLIGGRGDDRLLAEDGDDFLEGRGGDDFLNASLGDDTLRGGGGEDRLMGSDGSDTLEGGSGHDTFVFENAPDPILGVDRIVDFTSGSDVIELSRSAIAIPDATWLSGDAFLVVAGGAAQDAEDRILYDEDKGLLSFDADGNGAGDAIVFAVLGAGTVLAWSDMILQGA